jgi:hypothetical protein
LLANLNLSAIQQLQEGGLGRQPSEDDQKRLLRLQQLLKASWEGAFINGEVETRKLPDEGETHLKLTSGVEPSRSARSSLDDARIVATALPPQYELEVEHGLEHFIGDAVPVLAHLITRGVEKDDLNFIHGPLTEFLEKLARSNRAGSSTAGRGRQHVPLA